MFSGEHESDASSTTSEVPELPHTPRGINDRPLLQLYTTVSSRSDRPTSQVSMGVNLMAHQPTIHRYNVRLSPLLLICAVFASKNSAWLLFCSAVT